MVRMAKLAPLSRGFKGTLSEAYAYSFTKIGKHARKYMVTQGDYDWHQ